MIIHNVAQGTTAWNQLRAGIPTASMFDSIITPGGKKSDGQDRYMQHLIAERIRGRYIDGFKSKYMELGNQNESRAIASYELANDCDTEKIGFVTTDDGLIGCSPDRFIVGESRGGVEAKAPTPAVHVSYLLASVGASKEYKVQLQGQIWVCEWDWVDIVSYCDGFPDAVSRVNRDEPFIKEMAAHVHAFVARIEENMEKLRDRYGIKDTEPDQIEDYGGMEITDEDMAAMVADVEECDRLRGELR